MSEFDHLQIDGKLLQLLVAVIDTGSITGAANRLGVTQSAVSHQIDKLRAIVGDPLFVKSGRGIVPTARAETLAVNARVLLDELRRFAAAEHFDPAQWQTTLTIAANDFQRDLLLPALLDKLRAQAPGVMLRVIPSDVPSAQLLRDDACQLAITPRPPDATDILQRRLFDDSYQVFFDPDQRDAPQTLDDYLAAEHVTVVYHPARALEIDQTLAARGIARRFVATVPGFAGIPAFLRGSQRLATLPGRISGGLLRGFGKAPLPADLPFDAPTLPMQMIWHLRYRHDPAHRWLREQVMGCARASVSYFG